KLQCSAHWAVRRDKLDLRILREGRYLISGQSVDCPIDGGELLLQLSPVGGDAVERRGVGRIVELDDHVHVIISDHRLKLFRKLRGLCLQRTREQQEQTRE